MEGEITLLRNEGPPASELTEPDQAALKAALITAGCDEDGATASVQRLVSFKVGSLQQLWTMFKCLQPGGGATEVIQQLHINAIKDAILPPNPFVIPKLNMMLLAEFGTGKEYVSWSILWNERR